MKASWVLAIALALQVSCATQRQGTVVEVKPVKVAEVIIVQDVTTKKQVLDSLGAPKSYYANILTYHKPNNKVEYIDVTYIESDGTKWNFCLADRPECKRSFTVQFSKISSKAIRMSF